MVLALDTRRFGDEIVDSTKPATNSIDVNLELARARKRKAELESGKKPESSFPTFGKALNKVAEAVQGDKESQGAVEKTARGFAAAPFRLLGGLEDLGVMATKDPVGTGKQVIKAVAKDVKNRLAIMNMGRGGQSDRAAAYQALEEQGKQIVEDPGGWTFNQLLTLAGAAGTGQGIATAIKAAQVAKGTGNLLKAFKSFANTAKKTDPDMPIDDVANVFEEAASLTSDEAAAIRYFKDNFEASPKEVEAYLKSQAKRDPITEIYKGEADQVDIMKERAIEPLDPAQIKAMSEQPLITGKSKAKAAVPKVEIVSENQRKLVLAEARKAGFQHEQLKAILKEKYGIDSTNDIRKADVDAILTDLRKPKEPAKGTQAGEQGGVGSALDSETQKAPATPSVDELGEPISTRASRRAENRMQSAVDELGSKEDILKNKFEGDESAAITLGAGLNPEAFKGLAENALKAGTRIVDIGKKVGRELKSIEARFKSQPGKALVKELEDVVASEGQIIGVYTQPIRKSLMKLSEKEANIIGDALISGKPLGEVSADAKTVYENLQKIQRALGVRYSKANPNFRLREDFGMTRQLKQDVRDVLTSDMDNLMKEARALAGDTADEVTLRNIIEKQLVKREEQLSNEMRSYLNAASRQGMTRGEGVLELRRYIGEEQDLYRKFGSFHERRKIDFPAEFFERDIRKVIPQYIEGAAREIALAEKFGYDMSKFKNWLGDLDLNEAADARTFMKLFSGAQRPSLSPTFAKATDALTAVQYGKLSPTSTLMQLTQPFISYLPEAGYVRSAKAVGEFFTRHADIVDDIEKSGVLDMDFLHATGNQLLSAQKAGEAASGYLKMIGFSQANKMNQFTAGIIYHKYIRDLHGIANGKTIGSKVLPGRQAWAKGILEKRFGIDSSQPLTRTGLQKGIYRGVQESQLQKSVLKEMALMNHPDGRKLFTLTKFSLKQPKMVKDLVLDNIKASKSAGGVAGIMPLARLAAGGLITGEAMVYTINKIREFVRGEPVERQDRSLAEIWDDPNIKDIVIHAVNNLVTVGTLGALTDAGRVEFTPGKFWGDVSKRVGELFTPPQIEMVGSAFETLIKGLKGDMGIDDALRIFNSTAAQATYRLQDEQEKSDRFKRDLSQLRRLGYEDKAQERMSEQLGRFSDQTRVGLVLDEFSRTYKQAMESYVAGKRGEAMKQMREFEKNFPEMKRITDEKGKPYYPADPFSSDRVAAFKKRQMESAQREAGLLTGKERELARQLRRTRG